MSEMIIVQLSVEQLKSIVNAAMTEVVTQSIENYKKLPVIQDRALIGVTEMCKYLGISRSRFESYRDELIKAGMFKLGENNGSWRMKREDFEKWLKGKQE